MNGLEDLEARAKKYKWSSLEKADWNDWGLLFRFLVLICKLLANGSFGKAKTARKKNAWSQFLGGYLRKGKTIQEAAKDWKNRAKK